MCERETHREKIMEARIRELKLKARVKSSTLNVELGHDGKVEDEEAEIENMLRTAEKEFYKTIEIELRGPIGT